MVSGLCDAFSTTVSCVHTWEGGRLKTSLPAAVEIVCLARRATLQDSPFGRMLQLFCVLPSSSCQLEDTAAVCVYCLTTCFRAAQCSRPMMRCCCALQHLCGTQYVSFISACGYYTLEFFCVHRDLDASTSMAFLPP